MGGLSLPLWEPLEHWLHCSFGCCCPVGMGLAGGGRALVTSLLCGTSVTAAHGGLGAKWPREMAAREERVRASQTKLADEIFVLREERDAATGSHLMEDTSRLGGKLQELCLSLGWPSGRRGTEGDGSHCSQSTACGFAWVMCLGMRAQTGNNSVPGGWGR